MTIEQLINIADSASTILLVIIALYAFFKGWVIRRGEFDRVVESERMWRELALNGTHLANRAVDVASSRRRAE